MIGLTDTTHTLEVITAAALNTDYLITFIDTTAIAHTPGTVQGTITTATTTSVLAAPAASTYRGVKLLNIINRGVTPQVVTVQKDVSAVKYIIYKATLNYNESLMYTPENGFTIHDEFGRLRQTYEYLRQGTSYVIPIKKALLAADAQYYHYCWSKDNGTFGPWSPGTPGVDGRITDGLDATNDGGCVPLPIVATGYRRYLTRIEFWSQYLDSFWFYDVLWVNSGLVPTTTGAQAITTPTLPARDDNGDTKGEGCRIGLLVTVATTNAAAIYNSTISYTNSAGAAGRTAFLSNAAGLMIPATAVIGTIVWFALEANDSGVKSIESITLGTSLAPSGSPTISLLIARIITINMPPTVSTGREVAYSEPGLWIPSNACILGGYQGLQTSAAPAYFATLFIMDK